MIIVIGGEKGGTGKTTLATNLATKHLREGGDLLLVDTDKQGSASDWTAARDETTPDSRIASIQKFGDTLALELRDLQRKYKDIIVDTGGRDTVELRSSMIMANKFFIPLQASQFDVLTLGKMHRLVGHVKINNPSLQTYIIINRAPTNHQITEVKELIALLPEFAHFKLCRTIIHERIAFRKAATSGLGVMELDQEDTKATNEMDLLYQEVFYG